MMPTTYLMDRQGRVVHRVIGVVDTDSIRVQIRDLLAD
jgi:glutathione peroxidase-family protein